VRVLAGRRLIPIWAVVHPAHAKPPPSHTANLDDFGRDDEPKITKVHNAAGPESR
jgi:hypothetical protein